MNRHEHGYDFGFRQYGDLKYRSIANDDRKVRLGQVVVANKNAMCPAGTKGVVYEIRIDTVPILAMTSDGNLFSLKFKEIDWEETAKVRPVRRRKS